MIYLLQDCYKDTNNEYHDILKIGYSSRSFLEGRKSHYDTHNFGYTFLGEKEGPIELENYLHYRFRDFKISTEWFRYDQEIIDVFNEISWDDDLPFTSDKEIIEYSRKYILDNLIPNVSKLSDLFLEDLLNEMKEKAKGYLDLEYNENLFRKEILGIFEYVSSIERNYFKKLDYTDLPQIVGRQRDRSNPFKNIITLFYKTKRKGETQLTRENFDKLQTQRRESTKTLLDFYQKGTPEEKAAYVQKLKRDSELYMHDFVSISKNTNLPMYNSLIDISNERAWEVSQKDYQDKISVTKALQSQGFELGEAKNELDLIVSEFLDNHFFTTGIFEKKLKMYCEFMDTYQDNQYITEAVTFKIGDSRYRDYYNFYGTSGCRAKSFKEALLRPGIEDSSEEGRLKAELCILFRPGEKYTLKELKLKLASIYSKLGISRVAKAKDLEKYLKMAKTKVKLSDGTIENGYKIL